MGIPPGPSAPPALQLVRWIRAPFRTLDDCSARFGDAFTLRMPFMPAPIVIVSNPAAVKDVFALGPDEGHAGKANAVLRPLLGEHSLLVLDGAEHLRQRKMILPPLHGERMQAYGQTMIDMAQESIDRWPVGAAFPVHRPLQSITLQVILRTVFGIAEGPRFTELAQLLTTALDLMAQPLLLFPALQRDLGRYSPWGRFKRMGARASEILRGEIRRARERGTQHGSVERTDVLAMLVDARDESGGALTEDEIHDELVTLLVAGHETTATALAWTMRWLLPDRDLVGRLRDEIAGAGGDPARIARLEFLDATVKESLRLQPVVPLVGRILQEPAVVGGLALPAGAFVAPSIYLVHRRPSLYSEPERFRPERFLGTKPAAWEWLPFGGGLRKCVGAAFALYEMKMVLASVLPRIDMRLASPERVRTVRRGITIAPGAGLPVVVTTKRSREAAARAA
jgi:cytochrome P450 family 110